jgi:carbonic anhydrase
VLNIPHLIVMGHSRCGGVQGCHALCSGQAPELESPDSFVGNWLQILRPAYERMQRELQPGQDPLVALEQASVLQSLDHLLTHDFIRTRVEAGTLALHGTWLDIRSGEVSAYDPQIDAFVSLAA